MGIVESLLQNGFNWLKYVMTLKGTVKKGMKGRFEDLQTRSCCPFVGVEFQPLGKEFLCFNITPS